MVKLISFNMCGNESERHCETVRKTESYMTNSWSNLVWLLLTEGETLWSKLRSDISLYGKKTSLSFLISFVPCKTALLLRHS